LVLVFVFGHDIDRWIGVARSAGRGLIPLLVPRLTLPIALSPVRPLRKSHALTVLPLAPARRDAPRIGRGSDAAMQLPTWRRDEAQEYPDTGIS